MRRITWLAIGAVGGILVYRRGQRFWADTREQGLAASTQQAGASAWAAAQSSAAALATARDLLSRAIIASSAVNARASEPAPSRGMEGRP